MEIISSDLRDSCPILQECLESTDFHTHDEDMIAYIYEILWEEIGTFIRTKIVPKFWSYFQQPKLFLAGNVESEKLDSSEDLQMQYKLFKCFVNAVKNLNDYYEFIGRLLQKLDDIKKANHADTLAKLNEQLQASLLAQLPNNFSNVVFAFFSVSFRVFFNLHKTANPCYDNEDLDDSEIPCKGCKGCNQELEKCQCESLMSTILEVHKKLLDLRLMDRLAGQTMTSLVQIRIKEHIKNTCHGIFDRSHLQTLLLWLDKVVISWLVHIFHGNEKLPFKTDDAMQTDDDITYSDVISNLKVKLTFYVYENYALSVIEQFFSIIIDFPDSIPAIEDLKICMEKINLRRQIIKSLKSSLEARILHPGVNTMDILTGYVAAIKAIRYLDNSGVILETVTAPIKDYLRKRSDTVRCVVTSLTEEGPTDLSEELAKGDAATGSQGGNASDELSNWETWQPDPFGLETSTTQTKSVKNSRSADIISMVVDIYGSKELFMSEYRNLLADRLLTQLEFNPEKEIRNLELLKLRFGESLLHNCEVMLKDIADSKRINTHIHSDSKYVENKQFDISSLIISAQFWPSFNKESVELPEEIANEFQKYTKSYEEYKGNRTLNWRNVTGKVNIVIELGERVFDMTVAPTQAVIIYHFQNKSEWSLDDLSSLVKIPPSVLRRRIAFWQSHGIISESQPGIFKLIEEDLPKSQLENLPVNEIIDEDEDNESAMASASDQREEELQVFWSYIVGMLTNLDSLPIDRIHQMLKLFASNGLGVEFTQDDLKDFLQRKVRDHKLIYSGGVYQLAK